MNIIAVDTDSLSLKSLHRALKKCYPHEDINAFTTPKEALLFAEKSNVALVYTEILLEGTSGFFLVEKLKKLNPNVSVNFVSITDEFAVDSFRYHPDGYFLKPVNSEKLQQHLTKGGG